MVMFPHIQPTLLGAPGLAAKTSEWFKWRLFNGATEKQLSPDCLAAIMSFESANTFSPTITNPMSKAFGLIGFMPKLTKAVFDKEPEVIKAMSAEGQLELVLDWFGRFSKLKGTLDCGEYYIAVFMPGVLGFEDSYTLGVKDSTEPVLPNVKLTKGAVYAQNSGFDQDKDGAFTVGDVRGLMRDRVTSWSKNPRVPVSETEPAKPGVTSMASSTPKSSAWIWIAGIGAVGAAIIAARHAEASPRSNPRAPKGLPTDMNLRALDDVITRGHGEIGELPETEIPHIRRVLKAGYLESTGERGRWRLSPVGVSALEHFRARRNR